MMMVNRNSTGDTRKRENLVLGEMHIRMLEELVDAKVLQCKNKTDLMKKMILEKWSEHVAEHKIQVGDQTVYFFDQDSMEETSKYLNDYNKKGLVVDEQLVEYVCDRHSGFILK